MDRASLCALSHDDLISVILAQAEVIAQQNARIGALTVLIERQLAELDGEVTNER